MQQSLNIWTVSYTHLDWVHLGVTENGIAVNSYFAEHPEMMLGAMAVSYTHLKKGD